MMELLAITELEFVTVLVCCTFACTLGWEAFVKNHIYNCTTDLLLDFLQPDQWVHHLVSVAQVASDGSMREPDTILAGGSITALWCFWISVVGVSLLVSGLFARVS